MPALEQSRCTTALDSGQVRTTGVLDRRVVGLGRDQLVRVKSLTDSATPESRPWPVWPPNTA